jgi:hypothetical protein
VANSAAICNPAASVLGYEVMEAGNVKTKTPPSIFVQRESLP